MSKRQRVPPSGRVPVVPMGCFGMVLGAAAPVGLIWLIRFFDPLPENVAECLTGFVVIVPIASVWFGCAFALLAAVLNSRQS